MKKHSIQINDSTVGGLNNNNNENTYDKNIAAEFGNVLDNFADFDAFCSTNESDAVFANIEFSSSQVNGGDVTTKSTAKANERFLSSNINSSNKRAENAITCFDDEVNFADFSNANAFKATVNMKQRFETATHNTTYKSKSKTDCDRDTTEIVTEKVFSKFQDDYSKVEEFDADLQKALKRSVADQ